MSKSKVHVSPTHLLWSGGLTNRNRTGERFENQSVAQIVISTATDKSHARVQLCEPGTQQLIFPAPSRTSRIPPTPSITIHTQTSPDTPNTPRAEPRNCADRQDSQPRAHTDFRCHHCSATRLSRRSEGLRRCRRAGDTLRRRCGRFRLVRHGRTRSSRYSPHLRRWASSSSQSADSQSHLMVSNSAAYMSPPRPPPHRHLHRRLTARRHRRARCRRAHGHPRMCGQTRRPLLRILEQQPARLRRPQSSTRSGKRCTRCFVCVYKHAWMAAGYGVWGMDAYLERFWTCLDWAAVRDGYAQYAFRK